MLSGNQSLLGCTFAGAFKNISLYMRYKATLVSLCMRCKVIKLYLDVSDVVHANKHANYDICDLHVNFQVFVNVILFYNEKGSF